MDSGAKALGCAVIPAGDAHIPETLEALRTLQPRIFCGRGDFLDQLLFAARRKKQSLRSLQRALLIDESLSDERRKSFADQGIVAHQAYVIPEVGVIAFETEGGNGELQSGMVVNEGVILEIVKPGTCEPVVSGQVGEIVITRLNADYPLLRYGTGDLSAIVSGPSACGRTNVRIKPILGKASRTSEKRPQG